MKYMKILSVILLTVALIGLILNIISHPQNSISSALFGIGIALLIEWLIEHRS